jgi:hypothetical protein
MQPGLPFFHSSSGPGCRAKRFGAHTHVHVHVHVYVHSHIHVHMPSALFFPFLSIISLFFSHPTKPGRAHDMALYNELLCAGDEAAVRARAGARWVLVGVDVNSAAEVLEGRW